ncbi:hypothetical protein HK102_000615 [Quaeritorhiza haematococci]|nr:hypothetical protein HK102_000615 [Quaeritorhiza haematococci]
MSDQNAANVFYGQARYNVLSGRYHCTVQDAITLAALHLQRQGDHDPLKNPAGYLM